jgi:hypothetical protein
LAVAAGLAGTAVAPMSVSSAGTTCANLTRVFAVDSATGRLTDVPICRSTSTFGAPVQIDGGDWRPYTHLFAVRDGQAAVLYSTDAAGDLRWWRQEQPGARLSPGRRIGTSVDWAGVQAVFAPQPGDFHTVRTGGQVRTFRHDGWQSGGTDVAEVQPLLGQFAGPSMTAARWNSYGEGNVAGHHYRIWQAPTAGADAWVPSGDLPTGLAVVAGSEPALYAVTNAGTVALLRQPTRAAASSTCPASSVVPWTAAAKATGKFTNVVVPVEQSFPGAEPSLAILPSCSEPISSWPWEWQ